MPPRSFDLEQLAWPAARLGEALEITAHRAGLVVLNAPALSAPGFPGLPPGWSDSILDQWVDAAASRLGIEAEPMNSSLGEMGSLVSKAAPAILRLPPGPENASGRFLVLLTGGRILRLLGVELKEHRVPAEAVRDALYLPLVASLGPGVDQLLEHANIPAERRSHARLILLNEHLGSFRTNTGWMLRVSPGASLRTLARLGRLGRPTLLMLGAYLIQQALVVFS